MNGLETNMINVGQKLKISNCNCPTPKTEAVTVVENDIPDSFEATTEKRLIVDNNQKRYLMQNLSRKTNSKKLNPSLILDYK